MTSPILPGASLGILGSGQLGRMFAIEARRLGYGVHVYSPEQDTPAGQLADREWTGAYDDLDRLKQFAQRVAAVTIEFENISAAALRHLEQFVPVRPGAHVLETSQNRLREKRALQAAGLPTAPFVAVYSSEDVRRGLEQFGGRGVLKTASWGYDGKGQQLISTTDDLKQAWRRFEGHETILEGYVDFEFEFSVIGVRGADGDMRCYDPIRNEHRNHILDISVSPAPRVPAAAARRAIEIARTALSALDVIGVLCVEMFLTHGGDVVVNEVAPRPHNSGHLTIEAHECCQFQQQVRALCGLPLGDVRQLRPAAMANLLGDVWGAGVPHWDRALAQSGVHLHLYGKQAPRPGRKMGHLTTLADSPEAAEQMARAARDALMGLRRD